MKHTRLGHTGLKVSRLCLGAMTYGSSQWRDWILDEDASRPFFRRALELFELLVAATGEGQAELELWRAEAAGPPRLKLVAGASPAAEGGRESGVPAAGVAKRSRHRRRRRRSAGRGGAGEAAGT